MNRQQRRQAVKDFQAQLKTQSLAGAVDLSAPRQKSVFLGYPAGADIRVGFHRSVLAAAVRGPRMGYGIRPVDVEVDAGTRPKGLNLLLKHFLQGEDDYLLLADTNIAFAPQDVAMLIAADAAIAGALYFSAASGAEPWPTAWVQADAAQEGQEPDYVPVSLPTPPEDFLPTYEVTEDMSAEDKVEADRRSQVEAEWLATLSIPIPVAGVGMGLTLISRDCAHDVASDNQWPFEAVEDRREDLVFCLRAAAAGHQAVLMPAARVTNLQVGSL